MANNPRAADNLIPPWTSESAPKGRKNAGLSVIEWRNQLADYCKNEIEDVLKDPKAPAAKLIAATEMLAAINGDKDARRDLCNYTNGSPKQTIEQTNHDGEPRTESERAAARDNVLARIRSRITRPA